jgi:hypothetical protein
MSNAAKEARDLVEEAVRQGWRLRDMPGKHYFLFASDGVGKVAIPRTPSDARSLRNAIQEMRRHGFVWPPPKKRR